MWAVVCRVGWCRWGVGERSEGGFIFRRRSGGGEAIVGFIVRGGRRGGWSISDERRTWRKDEEVGSELDRETSLLSFFQIPSEMK